MDDQTAIEQCQAGNADAFRHIVEQYETEAMGHALAIVRHRQDAEDAVLEAFTKAFRALPRFEAGRRFYPWFYTILRNCCFKCVAQRPAAVSESDPPPEILAVAPDEESERQAQRLEQGLARLPAEDRELITLKHLDGLSYQALAERLEIPPGTVMSRLYHARQRLRAEINRLTQDL
jgi:RNA polymerase sigma-70 factor (ECF subfamily)